MDKLLKNFNLSNEEVSKILDFHYSLLNEKDLKLTEIETSLNLKNEEVETLNKSLEELKKVDVKEIQEKLSNLQEESKKRAEQYNIEVKNLKINSAIELELVKNGARNIKAARALIEMDKIQVDDKGTVIGINNQIKDLINGEETSFLFGKENTTLNNGKPIESSDVGTNINLGERKISYEQFLNNYGGN